MHGLCVRLLFSLKAPSATVAVNPTEASASQIGKLNERVAPLRRRPRICPYLFYPTEMGQAYTQLSPLPKLIFGVYPFFGAADINLSIREFRFGGTALFSNTLGREAYAYPI